VILSEELYPSSVTAEDMLFGITLWATLMASLGATARAAGNVGKGARGVAQRLHEHPRIERVIDVEHVGDDEVAACPAKEKGGDRDKGPH